MKKPNKQKKIDQISAKLISQKEIDAILESLGANYEPSQKREDSEDYALFQEEMITLEEGVSHGSSLSKEDINALLSVLQDTPVKNFRTEKSSLRGSIRTHSEIKKEITSKKY